MKKSSILVSSTTVDLTFAGGLSLLSGTTIRSGFVGKRWILTMSHKRGTILSPLAMVIGMRGYLLECGTTNL